MLLLDPVHQERHLPPDDLAVGFGLSCHEPGVPKSQEYVIRAHLFGSSRLTYGAALCGVVHLLIQERGRDEGRTDRVKGYGVTSPEGL